MTIQLIKYDGSVVLIGDAIDSLAGLGPGTSIQNRVRITVFTAPEVQRLGGRLELRLREFTDIKTPLNLGVGRNDEETYQVIFWSQGTQLRRQMKVPDKQFHTQLGYMPSDGEAQNRGTDTIFKPEHLDGEQVKEIIKDCQILTEGHKWRTSCDETLVYLAQKYVKHLGDESFDMLWHLLKDHGMYDDAGRLASSYCIQYPHNVIGHLRMGDSLEHSKSAKQAMFHYAHAALHDHRKEREEVLTASVDAIVKCCHYTEFGPVFQEQEIAQWQKYPAFFEEACRVFEAPEHSSTRRAIQEEYARYMNDGLLDIDTLLPCLRSIPSDQRLFVPWKRQMFKLPRFFRWLVPFRLALMSTPTSAEDVMILRERLMITTIITLTAEEPLPDSWFADGKSRNIFVPIKDFRTPSLQQVETFINAMSALPRGEAALLHCGAGKGRAGTLAACYLMACGFGGDSIRKTGVDSSDEISLFPAETMRLLRHLRPGSIESEEQEQFVRKFGNLLLKQSRYDNKPAVFQEPNLPLEILKGSVMENTTLIVCCGVPGSGKTSFASRLASKLDFSIICQDDLGTYDACLSALAHEIQSGKRAVVDLGNSTPEKRHDWLAHAFLPKHTLCAWFDVDPEICVARANARPNHPTIPQGKAKKIVMSISKGFVNPNIREKFGCIARIRSINAASELLEKLGAVAGSSDARTGKTESNTEAANTHIILGSGSTTRNFISFPRTRHLYNLGAATEDDRVDLDSDSFLSSSDPDVTITLEEKIDGANMGIQADSNSPTGFQVQSRSRFLEVHPTDQFKKVNKWISDHEAGLSQALLSSKNGEYAIPPGKYILYGEWTYAKHAIQYSRLPDTFIVFDMYDTETSTFLSRRALNERLAGTDISQVPVVPSSGNLDAEFLESLVQGLRSVYYDGPAEGIYLRREKGDGLIDHAKIVRKDFRPGNEKWVRGGKKQKGIVLNRVIPRQ